MLQTKSISDLISFENKKKKRGEGEGEAWMHGFFVGGNGAGPDWDENT